MKIIECQQGTEEWFQARLGVPSASNFFKLVTINGKPSSQADGYINALVAEKLTGQSTFVQTTDAMQRGIDLEPFARDKYQDITLNPVTQVGFCLHDEIAAGASPDGLVNNDGGLEIKCPMPHNHVEYLSGGKLPSKYFQQVQGCLWITGRDWWDFMSYHPQMKPLIVRVERDEDFIESLEENVRQAVERIDFLVNKFKEAV